MPVSVPSDVKLLAVTPLASVPPLKLPAGTLVMFVPLNVGLAPDCISCGNVRVTLPVDALTEILLVVPVKLNTPALVNVTELPNATVPPPLKPVPAETVTELLTSAPFGILVKLDPPNTGLAPDCIS
jgi:hypothetical protein